MTREQFDAHIQALLNCFPDGTRYEDQKNQWIAWIKEHEAQQRQVIEELTKKVNELERILSQKGYRKSCDILACNCGDQWNHGGLAEARLNEIDDALPYVNGKTILQRVEHQAHTIQRLREALDWSGLKITIPEIHNALVTLGPIGLKEEAYVMAVCRHAIYMMDKAQRVLEETA